jgi:hypothetical protein
MRRRDPLSVFGVPGLGVYGVSWRAGTHPLSVFGVPGLGGGGALPTCSERVSPAHAGASFYCVLFCTVC